VRDLLADLERLSADGPVGRAVVTSVWGSAPRREGACLLARADGAMAGSVSGGCVEAAAAEEIGAAIARGTPRLTRMGVTDETAWLVGLACGGTIELFIEPTVRKPVLDAARGPGGIVVATLLSGDAAGVSWIYRDDGTLSEPSGSLPLEERRRIEPEISKQSAEALRTETSFAVDLPGQGTLGQRVFFEIFPRQPRLVIIGAVHVAAELVPLARRLGYHTIVADGRAAFLTRARFPDADELILGWPKEAFERIGIDRATYVCILSHDPKFDEPALEIALRTQAAYVGAIGSKKTQQSRRERLAASGITPEQLARLHGPIGLDLGGREPAEIALAVLAEMTMARHGKT
jgi:xanthine dehydrogenase accessory factor